MLVSLREGVPELYVTLHAHAVGSGRGRWSKTEEAGISTRALTPASSVCVRARARACVRASLCDQVIEGDDSIDTDHDKIPNYLDEDSDGDGKIYLREKNNIWSPTAINSEDQCLYTYMYARMLATLRS